MINPDRLLVKPRFLFLIGSLFIMSGVASAQTVTSSIPDDSLTVGQVFNMSITVKSSSPYDKVIFPDSSLFNGDLEFNSSKHFKVNASSDSAEFTLQFFGVENITIPPLPVRIVANSDTNLVFTDPVQLLYKQTIASEEDPFKPFKPNFAFPNTIWPYLVLILLLLAISFFVWWKYFKNNEVAQTEPEEIPVFENPVSQLESYLSDIKEKHTNTAEKDFKWFYSDLGDALRWYIEELYKIPALESTSREVLRYMDAFGIDVELIKHTRKILNEADMAKFAKFKPTLDQSWKAFQEAELFLERAKVIDRDRIERLRKKFVDEHVKAQEITHGMG